MYVKTYKSLEGDTFEYDYVKMIILSFNISLDKLKHFIGGRMQLSTNQKVFKIWYQCPVTVNYALLKFRKLDLKDGAIVEVVVQRHLAEYNNYITKELLSKISFVERDAQKVVGPSMNIPWDDMLASQNLNWYNQMLDPSNYAVPMDAEVDLSFSKMFLNDVYHSSYVCDHILQPSSSDALSGSRPLLSFASTKVLLDLDSSNEDYELSTNGEEVDDMDEVMDINEVRNILADTSAPFFQNISTDNTSEDI